MIDAVPLPTLQGCPCRPGLHRLGSLPDRHSGLWRKHRPISHPDHPAAVLHHPSRYHTSSPVKHCSGLSGALPTVIPAALDFFKILLTRLCAAWNVPAHSEKRFYQCAGIGFAWWASGQKSDMHTSPRSASLYGARAQGVSC